MKRKLEEHGNKTNGWFDEHCEMRDMRLAAHARTLYNATRYRMLLVRYHTDAALNSTTLSMSRRFRAFSTSRSAIADIQTFHDADLFCAKSYAGCNASSRQSSPWMQRLMVHGGVRRRIVHACTEPKRIRVQHGIVRIDHLTHRERPGNIVLLLLLLRRLPALHHRLLLPVLGLMRLLTLLQREPLWLVETLRITLLLFELRGIVSLQLRRTRIAAALDSVLLIRLVEHRAGLLSIVLLFCTHGINLGRTQFYWGK